MIGSATSGNRDRSKMFLRVRITALFVWKIEAGCKAIWTQLASSYEALEYRNQGTRVALSGEELTGGIAYGELGHLVFPSQLD